MTGRRTKPLHPGIVVTAAAIVLWMLAGCGSREKPATPLSPSRQVAREEEKAAEPKSQAETVVESLPVLKEKDAKLKSILVKAVFRPTGGFAYEAELAVRKPDAYSLRVVDPRTGTPLLVIAEGRMLVFDSSVATVLSMPVTRPPALSVRCVGGRNQVSLGLAPSGTTGDANIVVDVASYFEGHGDRIWAVKKDDTVLLQSKTLRGAALKALLVPGDPLPWREFSIRAKKASWPELALTITPNAPIDDAQLALPSLKALAEHVKIEALDVPPKAWAREGNFMGAIVRILNVRRAAGDPRERGKVQQGLKREIDWDALMTFDKNAAQAWREITKSPAP